VRKNYHALILQTIFTISGSDDMTYFLQLAFLLALFLFAAKFGGFLSTRLGQPSVLGELIVGVLLGPSLLDLLHLPFLDTHFVSEVIHQFAELGVLVLMFLAGLELHFSDLTKNRRVSTLAGLLGVVVPVGLGFLVGELLGFDFTHSAFLGLTLGATSVSISVQTLMELKVLRSRVGLSLLGAAVFDDILVILLLSIFLAFASGAIGFLQILLVFGRILLFLALSVAFGIWGLPHLSRRISRMDISYGPLTFAIIILLAFGLAAELVGGMAAITGSFLAGLMFSRTPEKKDIEPGLSAIAYSLFVPIFFINIGLSINIRTLHVSAIWTILLIVAVAILGKIVGAGAGALISKFSSREALQLGIGMVSRGEVGLIVANAGLSAGWLNNEIFSAIVITVLVTTLITPIMLRAVFHSKPPIAPDKLSPAPSVSVEENA
jgi:Kef-type K+ transport system membrane component KefB